MPGPVLTVVTPSYNQSAYIRDCLAEPLAMSDHGVELIVMDGGSSDGTREILEELLGSRHRWESTKDRGQAHAINKGFALAQGEWVAFQNSDDYYLPGRLREITPILARETRAELLLGGMAFVDARGEVLSEHYPKPIFLPCLSQLNFLNNQALFVRRTLLDRAGLLDENLRFCLDYEWFVRLLRARPKVRCLYRIIGAQRLHEDTKTSNLGAVHDEEFSRVARRYFSPAERFAGRALLQPYRAFRLVYGILARRGILGR
jgi:glycosyltransferase involved in cell wall biosynthesis